MADRILVWHFGLEQPAYYMDKDYDPIKTRLYARIPPKLSELKVDIKADGVSIYESYAYLREDETLEENAGTFIHGISQGSIITCEIVESNGANDITVQLELDEV